jgi:urease accessory protein
MGWDVLCLGRTAAGEVRFAGACRQRLELFIDDRPLLSERASYGPELQAAPWGMRDASVSATFFATGPTLSDAAAPALLGQLRGLTASDRAADLLSATVVGAVLVLRYLGRSSERARSLFESAWRLVRPALLGRPACPPRIWST